MLAGSARCAPPTSPKSVLAPAAGAARVRGKHAAYRNLRRELVQRFPYMVLYKIFPGLLHIVAVMQTKQDKASSSRRCTRCWFPLFKPAVCIVDAALSKPPVVRPDETICRPPCPDLLMRLLLDRGRLGRPRHGTA